MRLEAKTRRGTNRSTQFYFVRTSPCATQIFGVISTLRRERFSVNEITKAESVLRKPCWGKRRSANHSASPFSAVAGCRRHPGADVNNDWADRARLDC